MLDWIKRKLSKTDPVKLEFLPRTPPPPVHYINTRVDKNRQYQRFNPRPSIEDSIRAVNRDRYNDDCDDSSSDNSSCSDD